ncbi:hypothetical protein V2H77_18400 [Photorhabdus sp. P32]|uniref:hypothetical protein n=1 Tax=Photorhabdus sp. P32 TaxID=3117549 RepID=UPI00311ADAD5
MENKYTVTYKVAPMGAKYVYQEDKGKSKAGDIHKSSGGHMWYVISDGNGNERSVGFESRDGVPFGVGKVTPHDNAAYQETTYEVTIALTEKQYKELSKFSDNPKSGGFNPETYWVNSNSCVDFVYYSLQSIGYNRKNFLGKIFEGNLFPNSNPHKLKEMLAYQGVPIIRDDLIRNGDHYEKRVDSFYLPPWKTVVKEGPLPNPPKSLINIDINSSPQPQKHIQGENKAQQDVANGFIQNSATHKISAVGDMLNKTDFTSTQMASLTTGGIRPGEMQLDPNVRPNTYLSEFYKPFYQPGDISKLDFGLRNAVTLNGLSAMTTFNTYVDPLLLDLSGNGAHMTDIRDGVLFDMDNSGTLKRSGWADRNTGILVIDDGSGQIKNASQMFSEYYGGKAGINGAAGEKNSRMVSVL